MSENGKGDVLTTRARRAAASTGATVRRTGRGIRAKAYGKLVEVHERMHAEAEAAAAEAAAVESAGSVATAATAAAAEASAAPAASAASVAEPAGPDTASGVVGESGTPSESPEAAPEKSD